MDLVEKTAQNLLFAYLQGEKAGYTDHGDSLPGKSIVEWHLKGVFDACVVKKILAIHLRREKDEKRELGGFFIDSVGGLPGGEGRVSEI